MSNIILNPEDDYEVLLGHETYWITAGSLSVCIVVRPGGVRVEVYPVGGEGNVTPEQMLFVAYDQPTFSQEALEELWDSFETPIDDDGFMDTAFLHFPAGTHREVVWKWFDERYGGGVAALLNGEIT